MTDTSPTPSSTDVRRRMEGQSRRDTAPELALRRELWSRGVRYRVDVPLPMNRRRRADLMVKRHRVAVFVDGCFWHACPQHSTAPKNNAGWWRTKLERNVARDRDTDAILRAADWTVVRVWEHEVREDVVAAADRVERALTGRAS